MIVRSANVGNGTRQDWVKFLRYAKDLQIQVTKTTKEVCDTAGQTVSGEGSFMEVADITANNAELAALLDLVNETPPTSELLRARLDPSRIGFSSSAKRAATKVLAFLEITPGLKSSELTLLLEEALAADERNQYAAYTDHGKYALLLVKDFLLNHGHEAVFCAQLISNIKQDEEFWSYQSKGGRTEIVYRVDGEFRSLHMTAQYFMDEYNLSFGKAYERVATITTHH